MAVQTDDTGSTRVGFDDDDDKRFELVSTKQTKIEVEFEITEVTTSDKSAEPGGPTLNEVKTMMENTRWALVRERMLSPKSRRPSKMAAVVAAAMQALTIRWQHSTAVTSGTPCSWGNRAGLRASRPLLQAALASGSKPLATDQRA